MYETVDYRKTVDVRGSIRRSVCREFFQVCSPSVSSHLPIDNPPCSFPLDGVANGLPVTLELASLFFYFFYFLFSPSA